MGRRKSAVGQQVQGRVEAAARPEQSRTIRCPGEDGVVGFGGDGDAEAAERACGCGTCAVNHRGLRAPHTERTLVGHLRLNPNQETKRGVNVLYSGRQDVVVSCGSKHNIDGERRGVDVVLTDGEEMVLATMLHHGAAPPCPVTNGLDSSGQRRCSCWGAQIEGCAVRTLCPDLTMTHSSDAFASERTVEVGVAATRTKGQAQQAQWQCEPHGGEEEPGAGGRGPGAGSREPGAGSREKGEGRREKGSGRRLVGWRDMSGDEHYYFIFLNRNS